MARLWDLTFSPIGPISIRKAPGDDADYHYGDASTGERSKRGYGTV
jgi:hypothetical protein